MAASAVSMVLSADPKDGYNVPESKASNKETAHDLS